jgi:S-DNA-T family DNA segregation ATPase FtsK/SpoIIIE
MGEDSGINVDVDISERDTLFRSRRSYCQRTTRLGIIVTKKTKTRLQQSRSTNRPIRSGWYRRVRLEVKHVVYILSALDQFFNNEQNN